MKSKNIIQFKILDGIIKNINFQQNEHFGRYCDIQTIAWSYLEVKVFYVNYFTYFLQTKSYDVKTYVK